jgi:hypothetical protein
MRFAFLCSFVCWVVPSVALAQKWLLPEGAAAVYKRDIEVRSTNEPEGLHLPALWHGPDLGGVILASDLDSHARAVAVPPADARDWLMWVCSDLSITRAKKVRLTLPAIQGLMSAQIEVQFEDFDDHGRQSLQGVIRPVGGVARKAEAAADSVVLSGILQGHRVVDLANGRLQSLACEMELFLKSEKEGQTGSNRRVVTDRWEFDSVVEPDTPAFRGMVTDALERAVDALRKELTQLLDRKTRPLPDGNDAYHDHQAGDLALTLLALAKALEDPADSQLQAAWEVLREMPVVGTYSLAVSLMAMEALHTPPGEARALREGSIHEPLERKLSQHDRQLAERWTAALLENIDQTVDAAYLRRWHYGPSGSWDNSNTHYALLGLYAGHLCGVEISDQVWHAAAQHWLEVMVEDGKPARVALMTYQQRDEARAGERVTVSARRAQPIGWSYKDDEPPTGTMTAAGVGCLTLCRSVMRQRGVGTRKQFKEIDAAIAGGFAWLAQDLSYRRNPGNPARHRDWLNYYLYALERACELNSVALVVDRDWYFEGACNIVAKQFPGGSWAGSWDTAFCVLFLKKSSMPTYTGR